MEHNDLGKHLQKLATKYETTDFISNDPIQIPHRYRKWVKNEQGLHILEVTDIQTVEISAFITSWLCWGSRKQIIKTADYIDREIIQGDPVGFIMERRYEKIKDIQKSLYRTFTYNDFYYLCKRLNEVYDIELTLEETNTLLDLKWLFAGIKGIPHTPDSACKRLNLFLRWMVRKNSPVDFGIWTTWDANDLIMPLDVHVLRQAQNLGLTTSRTANMRTAVEITDKLREYFPNDPTKGDFALFGLGVNE